MAEPTTTTAAALFIGSAAAVPMLTLFGMPLGLRADELLAGFAGALAAMVLLDSVPSTGDSLRELVRTTIRRVGVAVASAVLAGYCVPLIAALLGVPTAVELGLSFLLGGGAQRLFRAAIEGSAKRLEGKP